MLSKYYIFHYEATASLLPEERYLSNQFKSLGLTPEVTISRLIPYSPELEPSYLWKMLACQDGFIRKCSYDTIELPDDKVDRRKVLSLL